MIQWLRAHSWTVVVTLGLAGMLGGVTIAVASWAIATPQYTASAQLRLIVEGEPGHTEAAVRSAFRQAEVLAELAVGAAQLDAIGRMLDPPATAGELVGTLTARKQPELLVITFLARAESAERAAEIANAAAANLVSAGQRAGTPAHIRLEIIAAATPPALAPHPYLPRNLAIGAVAGAALGLAAALVTLRRRDGDGVILGPRQAIDRGALALGGGLGLAIIGGMALQLPAIGVQAVAFLAVVVAVMSPGAGLATLALTLPMREPPGFAPLGYPALLIGATAFGLLLAFLACGARLRPSALTVLAIGYLAASGVDAVPALSGLDAEQTVDAVARLIQVGAGVILIAVAWWYFSRYDARPYLVIAIASAALAGTLGILQASAATVASTPFIGLMFTPPDAVQIARATGPFFNTNYYGFFLGLSLVLVASLATQRGWIRLAVVAALPIGAGLLLTFSRGAFLAAGAGLVALVWTRNRTAGIVMTTLAAFLLLAVIPVVLDARSGASYLPSTSGFANEISDQGRLGAMLSAFPVWLSDPLFGAGFGQYANESAWFVGSSTVTSSHNEYLGILAEQGVIGFTMLGAVGLGLAAVAVSAGGWARHVAIASLVAFAVGWVTIEPLASLQTSGVMWLTLGAAAGEVVRARRPPVEVPRRTVAPTAEESAPGAVGAASG